MGFEMLKTFEVNDHTYTFTYHPRTKVPLVLPDIHAPRELSDVYDSYSEHKAQAWRKCFEAYKALYGFYWSIDGYNCMTFTVRFYFPDPETGVLHCARMTRDYWHLYEVEG